MTRRSVPGRVAGALAGVLALSVAVGAGCSGAGTKTARDTAKDTTAMKSVAIHLTSPVFQAGADIPKKYTCEGEDVSPALRWDAPPPGTRSLALIVDDPDAPMGTWVHWVMYNLPDTLRELAENTPKQPQLESGARQGTNSGKKTGYSGPCPPPGKPHRYFFKLYALDTVLRPEQGATKADLEKALQGHVLAEGELMGRYKR